MSDQSHSWYVRGEGNQPAGPFAAEELLQSVRAGRLDLHTICWREGMSQWLPLGQIEPFASATASASVPRQVTAGAVRSPTPRADAPSLPPPVSQAGSSLATTSPSARGSLSSPPASNQPATPRRAPPAWLGWAIGGTVAATCAVIGVAFLLLSAGTTGHNWGSSYSVDYTLASPDGFDARFKTTVKGPAAKLAVILTDPKGESDTQIIEKESMISNSQTVELPMRNLREGTYVLTVKTVEPEKVVWQKNIPLSLGQLTVADVKFDLTPNLGQYEGYCLEGVNVVLNKDGNLPVKFADVSVAVDGNECRSKSIRSGVVMVDQQHTVGMQVHFSATAEMEKRDRERGRLPAISAVFRPGEPHSVKGQLFYGEDRKSLEFEKEFVTPQDNKKPGDAGASVPPTSPGATPPPGGPQVSSPKPTKPEFSTPEKPLHKPLKKPRTPRTPRVTPPADENPLPKGSLSGTWQNSVGERFRIDDDGTTARVTLASSKVTRALSGELARPDGDEDAKSLSGTFVAVFKEDAPRQHRIRVTATLDDSGQLQLQCAGCPLWNKYGKMIGTRIQSQTWTRQQLGRAGNTSATRKTDGHIRLSGQ